MQDNSIYIITKPLISETSVVRGPRQFREQLPCQVLKDFITPAKKKADLNEEFVVAKEFLSLDHVEYNDIEVKNMARSLTRQYLSAWSLTRQYLSAWPLTRQYLSAWSLTRQYLSAWSLTRRYLSGAEVGKVHHVVCHHVVHLIQLLAMKSFLKKLLVFSMCFLVQLHNFPLCILSF